MTGILKGYDQLLNLVLDDVEENILGMLQLTSSTLQSNHALEPEPHTRTLGLAVLRGPTITLINPVDGSEEIANPFAEQQ